MDHDESSLMAELAGLNSRIARFILDALDRDAARPHSWVEEAHEEIALGHDLVALGGTVRRHARLRTARWGHSYLEPRRGHIRATESGATTVSAIDGAAVGPAVCGAWLVADLPAQDTTDVATCSVCLAVLAQEP